MSSFCCPECFGDRHLKLQLFPALSINRGQCSYCGSNAQLLLNPIDLREQFELLISLYTRDEDGQTLVEWLKKDWAMFSHEKMDVAHSKDLLGEILDDGEIVRRKFSPREPVGTQAIQQWEQLRTELMHRNRFFPAITIDLERLARLLPYLLIDTAEIPQIWHRARIQQTNTTFMPDEMGCPPKHLASHGRANPAGIPYLYLASEEITAISEVRPQPGEVVSVARFSIPELKIIDLQSPRRTVSPFILSDEIELSALRADIEFLEKLGEELTRPVLQRSAAFDYIPSQYLCEYAKRCGFDGVMYRSAAEGGSNLALFDAERAKVIDVSSRSITRVVVEI